MSDNKQTWSYASPSGGIANTSDVTIASAPTGFMRNYLTDLQIRNEHALNASEVCVKANGVVVWRMKIPATSAPFIVHLRSPIGAPPNTALVLSSGTACTLHVSAQGFIDD